RRPSTSCSSTIRPASIGWSIGSSPRIRPDRASWHRLPAVTAVIRSRRVVTPAGIAPAAIHVRGGTIERVAAWDEAPAGSRLAGVGELAVLPGIVDTHVHLNEPGRTEWEGFETATRAAAIGGVTTLVDMPLNSIPPTTTREAFAAKRDAARGRCSVDVGFWGGVVPGNAREL